MRGMWVGLESNDEVIIRAKAHHRRRIAGAEQQPG